MLVAAFDAIREDARSAAFFDGATDEDVHTLVIRKLKERVGALADKIHTGRSRNEQVSLDMRLWLRDEIDRASELLPALMEALLDLRAHESGRRRSPAIRICGARSRCCGRIICWRISKCSRAISSASAKRARAST